MKAGSPARRTVVVATAAATCDRLGSALAQADALSEGGERRAAPQLITLHERMSTEARAAALAAFLAPPAAGPTARAGRARVLLATAKSLRG